jgi:hypothetical protein
MGGRVSGREKRIVRIGYLIEFFNQVVVRPQCPHRGIAHYASVQGRQNGESQCFI